jgi:hypothetical protein
MLATVERDRLPGRPPGGTAAGEQATADCHSNDGHSRPPGHAAGQTAPIRLPAAGQTAPIGLPAAAAGGSAARAHPDANLLPRTENGHEQVGGKAAGLASSCLVSVVIIPSARVPVREGPIRAG